VDNPSLQTFKGTVKPKQNASQYPNKDVQILFFKHGLFKIFYESALWVTLRKKMKIYTSVSWQIRRHVGKARHLIIGDQDGIDG
jgi:hypothetical protein